MRDWRNSSSRNLHLFVFALSPLSWCQFLLLKSDYSDLSFGNPSGSLKTKLVSLPLSEEQTPKLRALSDAVLVDWLNTFISARQNRFRVNGPSDRNALQLWNAIRDERSESCIVLFVRSRAVNLIWLFVHSLIMYSVINIVSTVWARLSGFSVWVSVRTRASRVRAFRAEFYDL